MAEEGGSQAQDKTEEPTPKRLQDAKEKGQVPRSRELNTTVVLMAGAAGIFMLGDGMGTRLSAMMRESLTFGHKLAFDSGAPLKVLADTLMSALGLVAPFLVLTFIAALVAPLLIGGWSFSMKAAAPKFSKLNPLKGMKRIFSARGLMELLKAVAKVVLIAGISILLINSMFGDLMALGSKHIHAAIGDAESILIWSFLAISSSMLLVAAIDVPFQIWQHKKQLKMSKQEVKDERKDTEGDPEVKGRVRQMQQQMAMSRMMEAVPEADVIVTNPTHFAVALKYDDARMAAPIVVAKGRDLLAARIRELANENRIPIFSAPPLARALYHSTELNDEIPAALYLAVAQVLAYIFQLQESLKTGSENPEPPTDLEIPEDYQR
jgi:flagellar biosynthetic protein FlhB